MEEYLRIVEEIVNNGVMKKTRTGVPALTIPGAFFSHDMKSGFPLLTTKKMAHKSMRVELEGFVKGITDKKWYQDRGCKIWNNWCNPEKVPYGHDELTKVKMKEERDLGPIYGYQWRNFDGKYRNYDDYDKNGEDQLEKVIRKLKEDPTDRRMLVSAWNPGQIHQMALPPCHYAFQIITTGQDLNLIWDQRSVDTMLGLPFNIASYGTLLHLLALESGLNEGKLVGMLGDVHIYENHLDKADEQLSREPMSLPHIKTNNFSSIFDWTHDQTNFIEYNSHDKIDFPIAV